MTYNGWTNYETWLTNLWFDNWGFIDMADDGYFDDMDEDAVRNAIAEQIRLSVEDHVEDMTNSSLSDGGFIGDVLASFIREVDWQDLADQYVEEVMEALNNNG